MATFITIYLAGVAASFLSLKLYLKWMKKIEKELAYLAIGFSLIPFLGYIISFIMMLIVGIYKFMDYLDDKKRKRKKEKRKSFIETFLNVEEGGWGQFRYIEKDKKKEKI